MDSLGLTWIHVDSFGFTGIHWDSLGFTWIRLDALGLTWSHCDSSGLTWIQLHSLGLTWTYLNLDSLRLTWTHLDSLELTDLTEGNGKSHRAERGKGNGAPDVRDAFAPGIGPARTHAHTTRNDFPVTGGPCLKANSLPPTSDAAQNQLI